MSLGGSKQAGTTTTTNAPYSGYLPFIGTALQQAGNLAQTPGPQYYPGQQVASFNPAQQAAMKGTLNLDQNLMQGSGNPYENAMFNQAAQSTQGQLASEFAGSGRDITGSMPLRAQQLNQLGTDFYGQNYQNDIQNAIQAANQRLGIGNQIQSQSQNLINASQNAYNYNQQLPYKNLQQYESFLSGVQPGSSVSSPYFNNPSANLLGSALAAQQLYKGYGSKPASTSSTSSDSLGGFQAGGIGGSP